MMGFTGDIMVAGAQITRKWSGLITQISDKDGIVVATWCGSGESVTGSCPVARRIRGEGSDGGGWRCHFWVPGPPDPA